MRRRERASFPCSLSTTHRALAPSSLPEQGGKRKTCAPTDSRRCRVRQPCSKNRIMPDFLCPVSASRQEGSGHLRNHFVIAVVASAPRVFCRSGADRVGGAANLHAARKA